MPRSPRPSRKYGPQWIQRLGCERRQPLRPRWDFLLQGVCENRMCFFAKNDCFFCLQNFPIIVANTMRRSCGAACAWKWPAKNMPVFFNVGYLRFEITSARSCSFFSLKSHVFLQKSYVFFRFTQCGPSAGKKHTVFNVF